MWSPIAPADRFTVPPLIDTNSKEPPDNTLAVPDIAVPDPLAPETAPPDDTVRVVPAMNVPNPFRFPAS